MGTANEGSDSFKIPVCQQAGEIQNLIKFKNFRLSAGGGN